MTFREKLIARIERAKADVAMFEEAEKNHMKCLPSEIREDIKRGRFKVIDLVLLAHNSNKCACFNLQIELEKVLHEYDFERVEKPPLGLKPRNIAVRHINKIVLAINRFRNADKMLPYAWLQELINLNNELLTIDMAVDPKAIAERWAANEKHITEELRDYEL